MHPTFRQETQSLHHYPQKRPKDSQEENKSQEKVISQARVAQSEALADSFSDSRSAIKILASGLRIGF